MSYISNFNDVIDYLKEEFGYSQQDLEFLEAESSKHIPETFEFRQVDPNNNDLYIISNLHYDQDTESPFESDDGAGEFVQFKSQDQAETVLNQLKKKSKLFYFVEKYNHGNVHYSIVGTKDYPDRRWDVSSPCGVFIPCDDIQSQYKRELKTKTKEEAKELFKQDSNSVLNTYSEWCNGESYYYSVLLIDLKNKIIKNESCGGFIGFEYANSSKNEEVKNIIENYKLNNAIQNIQAQDLAPTTKLPFRITKKGLTSGKVYQLDQSFVVSAKYQNDGIDGAKIYSWTEGDLKADKTIYSETQKKYNVSIDDFLNMATQSRLKEILRTQEKKSNTKKL